jgi:hypothetical protein
MPLPTAEQLLGRSAAVPAGCPHRCRCSCHRTGARHQVACCTPCGYGHSQIDPLMLELHLRTCHAYDCI